MTEKSDLLRSLTVMFAAIAATWTLGGCLHHSSVPKPAAPTGSNLSPVDAGRSIFTSTCTSCHAAKTITNYTLDQWQNSILPDMSSRAGLSAEQEQDVLAYVQSVLNASH